ncbi:UvrD-helicase domain-containing protein [Allorhodopirellula solitaria]|uniref:DNA 3'-5' helicase n=1 Tax=Allorhodopirellula solitaria TaxID=2527987 RepID=A0A5C5WY31_9BACT|nr:UvrD-helicase domain-containing protein [Allorhodopirellula solitaria]TWT55490.1 ATP-dependent helicase/nuclease subunit A [Allorhodopirellula solitaria]
MSQSNAKKGALELIRAGAGSGKTYDLCETVAKAVCDGLDPARIMATTFTKKAAAELKGRVQAKLLAGTDDPETNHRNADRLELAAIGTVHSVAHRVLSRYAVELGLSTRLEVMSEQAAEQTVSKHLSDLPMEGWQSLVACARRLGIDDLNQQLLTLLDAKRSNQISDEGLRLHLRDSASRVCELLSPLEDLPSPSFDVLTGHVRDALNAFAALDDTTGVTEKARKKLLDLRSERLPKWGAYAEASRLTAGKKSGADAALTALRNHGSEVCNFQGLHDDVNLFAGLIAQHTILIESGCRDYKIERGLVDFTDLETLFLEALSGEQLVELISDDFSLVLVDEFQDTNPLQLAIFQAMRRISPRNRWVGDPKQAIFGFRGTDPGLVGRVWEQAKDATTGSLPSNRRSQKGLVQFVGKMFEPIFGPDSRQEPVNAPLPRGIERWLFQTTNQERDAQALAAGILELQREGTRLGDIVVLERSNAALEKLADALGQAGIAYLFESPGLLSTREGVMAIAGMRLVSDRNDSLAAATLKHMLSDPSQATPSWIRERLIQLQSDRAERENAAASAESPPRWKQPWDGDDELAPLEGIDRQTSSPHSVCQLVIEALDLPNRVAGWGDVASRCSNLDSILRHVASYEEQMLGAGQAATLGGAILNLEEIASNGEDIKFPPLGHDAVTIMTYHKAKGLQWPVVILSGLHSDRAPNVWEPAVYGGGEDIDHPLTGRVIRAWTWPFGMNDGRPPKRRTGTSLEADALASPEGRQKAEDEINENLRLLYVGCTRAESKLVFAHRLGKDRWLQRLPGIDSILPTDAEAGVHELTGIDTSYVLRNLDPVDESSLANDESAIWFSFSGTGQQSAEPSPRFLSPSQAQADPAVTQAAQLESTELPGGSHFPAGLDEESYSSFGDAIHAYMAALPSLLGVSESQKQSTAIRCLAAYSIDGKLAPSVLVATGDRFVQWVNDTFPDATWRAEVPALASRGAGGFWNGTLDLILELPDQTVVVVDHKSAPIRRANCESKARQYISQLDAYNEMLAEQGCSVASRWIHFPLAGVMVKVEESICDSP